MLSLNERKHLSSTFKFDPRPKPSSPTLLPKGEGSKLSKYVAQTPTDFNFLIREVCQHPFKAGLNSSVALRPKQNFLTTLIESFGQKPLAADFFIASNCEGGRPLRSGF